MVMSIPRRGVRGEALLAAVERLPGPIIVYSEVRGGRAAEPPTGFCRPIRAAARGDRPNYRLAAHRPGRMSLYQIPRVVFDQSSRPGPLGAGFHVLTISIGVRRWRDVRLRLFYRFVSDRSLLEVDRARYRQALLAYCGRDTLALMSVHLRLKAITCSNSSGELTNLGTKMGERLIHCPWYSQIGHQLRRSCFHPFVCVLSRALDSAAEEIAIFDRCC